MATSDVEGGPISGRVLHMEDYMSDFTKLVRDLPKVTDVISQYVETHEGPSSESFVCFQWQGTELWVHGQAVWHNRMRLPDCWLRCGSEERLYKSQLLLYHWNWPYQFAIFEPRARGAARGPWAFAGFAEHVLVNMNFVRDEAERLEAEEKLDERAGAASRPPKGLIV